MQSQAKPQVTGRVRRVGRQRGPGDGAGGHKAGSREERLVGGRTAGAFHINQFCTLGWFWVSSLDLDMILRLQAVRYDYTARAVQAHAPLADTSNFHMPRFCIWAGPCRL